MRSELKTQLRELLGGDGLVTDPAELAHYGTDRCRGPWTARPSAVVFPRSTEQVQGLMRLASEFEVAVVPSGGRTGLAGAATATCGELVVSLDRMKRIDEVDAVGRSLRCEAGATLESVRDAAAARGLCYPVDYAAKGSAQIGGSIATNAGGVNVLRYGMTREWVAGLQVVLASGDGPGPNVALLEGRVGGGHPKAFVCRNFVCALPVDTPEALRGQLDDRSFGTGATAAVE